MVKETVATIEPEKSKEPLSSKLNIIHRNSISEKEQDQLRALISQYGNISKDTANPRKLTPVRNMTHSIITDNEAVRMKPYRIPHAWNKDVSDEVQQMLDNKIIR